MVFDITHSYSEVFKGARPHHVGIACKEIAKTRKELLVFFPEDVVVSEEVFDEELDATLQLVSVRENFFFELVSGNSVKSFLNKNISLYHLCFEVNKIDQFVSTLPRGLIVPITRQVKAKLFKGRKVQFFISSFGLVELLENNQ